MEPRIIWGLLTIRMSLNMKLCYYVLRKNSEENVPGFYQIPKYPRSRKRLKYIPDGA